VYDCSGFQTVVKETRCYPDNKSLLKWEKEQKMTPFMFQLPEDKVAQLNTRRQECLLQNCFAGMKNIRNI
jgi:hypothetical protein